MAFQGIKTGAIVAGLGDFERCPWEDECDYVGADADKYGPTFKDLIANNATILKSMLSKASDYCSTSVTTALLGKN